MARYTRRRLVNIFYQIIPRFVCPCCGNTIAVKQRIQAVVARPVSRDDVERDYGKDEVD